METGDRRRNLKVQLWTSVFYCLQQKQNSMNARPWLQTSSSLHDVLIEKLSLTALLCHCKVDIDNLPSKLPFLSPELVAGVPRGAQNFGYVSTKDSLQDIFLFMHRNALFHATFNSFKMPFIQQAPTKLYLFAY